MNHDHNTEERKCCNRKPKETKTEERYLSLTMEEELVSFRPSSYIMIEHQSDYKRLIKLKETVCVGKTEYRGMRGTGASTIRAHFMHGWKCHKETPYFVKLICVKNFK